MNLKDFPLLSDAEQKVIDAHKAGGGVILSDSVPVVQTDQNTIRAGLITYLATGGCDVCPTPAAGVHITGAWIDGLLNMEGQTSTVNLSLHHCNLPMGADFDDATLRGLYLDGSQVQHLRAQRAHIQTNLHLRGGFTAQQTVDLMGARIDGQLACVGGHFDGQNGPALNCDALHVGADVFLRDGFRAKGAVVLRSAHITGQLDCSGGHFDGQGGPALNCDALHVGADVFLRDGFRAKGAVDLRGADISGDLVFQNGQFDGPLVLYSATIGANLFFDDLRGAPPVVDLRNASVGVLYDDACSWAGVKMVSFDHFRYDRLESQMGIEARINLLNRAAAPRYENPRLPDYVKKRDCPNPSPQPYVHLAKVLRDAGHRSQSARVLLEKEKIVRRAERAVAQLALDGTWRAATTALWVQLKAPLDWVFRAVFGYGHVPQRALLPSAGIIFAAYLLYGHIWALGQFAPNSAVILTSSDWLATMGTCDPKAQLEAWISSPSGADYETFHAALYALDLFVPLDALGQEDAWRPSHDRGGWGAVGYWMRTPIQVAGWVITAVAAAIVTGLVGRKD